MINILDQERRNINQFYLTAGHTLSGLYRTNGYIEQLEAIIKKLNHFLAMHESFKKNDAVGKTKEYAKLVNHITVEFHYLIATNQAMEDNLKELNKTEGIQCEISGKMIDLKKEINRIVKRVDAVLKA